MRAGSALRTLFRTESEQHPSPRRTNPERRFLQQSGVSHARTAFLAAERRFLQQNGVSCSRTAFLAAERRFAHWNDETPSAFARGVSEEHGARHLLCAVSGSSFTHQSSQRFGPRRLTQGAGITPGDAWCGGPAAHLPSERRLPSTPDVRSSRRAGPRIRG